MCENTYIGVWSFSGISSRIQPLAHMPCCSSWSFYPKKLRLPVLNEMHTNSCTGPRLLIESVLPMIRDVMSFNKSK